MPNSRWIFDQNYRHLNQIEFLAGTDEAGRGAMAGPIVVAAIILPSTYKNPLIRDSKKLTAKQRTLLFAELIEVAISFAIEIIDVATVETLNPKQASIWGMQQTLTNLSPQPQLVLVDGEQIEFQTCPTVKLIKGDDFSLSIGAASILAKVTRDQIMIELSSQYPEYEWEINKGYCTLTHQALLNQFGLTPYHRKTYAPVKRAWLKFDHQKQKK